MKSRELAENFSQHHPISDLSLRPDHINIGIAAAESKILNYKDQFLMMDPNLLVLEGIAAGLLISSLSKKPRIAAIGVQLFLAATQATSEFVGLNSNGYENAIIATITPALTVGILYFLTNKPSIE